MQTRLDGEVEELSGLETDEGHLEYELFADRTVDVRWSNGKRNSRNGKE